MRTVLQTRRALSVSISDPNANPAEDAQLRRLGIASLLMLPLITGDEVVGLAVLDQREYERAFAEAEVRLYQAVADQAAIAIGNARLYEHAKREIAERKRTEQELRHLKEFNEAIVRNASEGIVIVDADGCLTFVNPAAATLLGYTREELLGQQWTAVVPPEYQPVVQAADNRREKGESSRYELMLAHKEGRLVPVQVSGQPWREEGRIAGSLAVFSDISERVRVEEQMRQRTAQLEALRGVGLEIAAQLNIEDLLHSIVERAVELVGGRSGGLYLYRTDQEVLEWVVSVNSSQVPMGSVLRKGEGLSGKIWESGEPLIVDDYEHWEGRAKVFDGYPCRAIVGVPIQRGDDFLGVVVVEGNSVGDFSSAHAEMLRQFAIQASIALSNARLHSEIQRRLNEQVALREAVAVITSALDLETVLAHIAEQMAQALDATSAYICDHNTEELTSAVLAEYIGSRACSLEQRSDLGSEYVEDDQEFLETMKAGRHDINYIRDPQLSEYDRAHMEEYGAKAILYIPLLSKGRLIGHTELWESRRERQFTTEEIALCQDLARQAAIAIENARLYKLAQQEIAERKRTEEELEETVLVLRDALSQVKTLSGLLPICAKCKKIRDDGGYWHSVEAYVRDHSEADFSHGICPDCAHQLYPWFKGSQERRRNTANGG
jgi:PAS domain S-box-containing protein